MKSLHPASVILLGVSVLIAIASRQGSALMLFSGATVLGTLWGARSQFLLILRRSRWLLLTMMVLFGWMTPGAPVGWLPGASAEGLQLATEHVARLVLAIAAAAALLSILSPSALVVGLRALLSPLAVFGGDFRDRLAVRLVLTLEQLEALQGGTTGEAPGGLVLERRQPGTPDALLALASAAMLAFALLA